MELAAIEGGLRQELRVKSVQDLEGFPSGSYSEFLTQYRTGRVQVHTKYDHSAFHVLASSGHRLIHYVLTGSPVLVSSCSGFRFDYPVELLAFTWHSVGLLGPSFRHSRPHEKFWLRVTYHCRRAGTLQLFPGEPYHSLRPRCLCGTKLSNGRRSATMRFDHKRGRW